MTSLDKLSIIIHRGSNCIGGSCVELSVNDYRIIIDLGFPLMSNDGREISSNAIENASIENGILPNVTGLFLDDEPSVDAVVLSHAHMDHYGLMNLIHPSIPIYLSDESQTLVQTITAFSSREDVPLLLNGNIQSFKHWEPFKIGPFTITSYLMDHSAFGSSSLVVRFKNKTVFYTGDFRGHGRKKKLFDRLVNNPIRNLDCMIMEGTSLGGGKPTYPTEDSVENKLTEKFKALNNICFVIASGSNIDRLVSLYKAALLANKTLVVDLYQYHLLKQLKRYSPGLPPHENKTLRVLYIKSHCDKLVKQYGEDILYQYKAAKINEDELLANRKNIILRLSLNRMSKIAEKIHAENKLHGSAFIYSMWAGYLERQSSFKEFSEKFDLIPEIVHTSGHAYSSDLVRLVEALKPKVLIPIHTLKSNEFSNYFSNVRKLGDGEVFTL